MFGGDEGPRKVAAVAGPIPAASGRIFISYRREETAYPAGWLYDRLAAHYGDGMVFKDVDSIELGDDFVEVINRAVESCDVLLALVGDEWLSITDEDGRRRLDDPTDFVRLEIEAALTRNVRVIPILVDGARLPRADELAPSLAGLVRRQALELSPARFDFDTSRLLKVLDKTLAEVRTAHDSAAAVSTPAGKALDPSTEQPEPERRERPEPRPTRAPAAPAVAPPPSNQSQLPVKQRPSKRAWILAGAGAAVALILLVFAILAIDSLKPVIFEDDFSSQQAGWEVENTTGTGSYTNDAYSISARRDGAYSWALPKQAGAVFPVAAAAISIEATTARASSHAQYGVLCRANRDDSAYAFLVQDGTASIVRRASGQNTTLATAQVDLADRNDLYADCDGNDEQGYVYLQLLVNGEQAAAYTDKDPLSAGTVAMIVTTGEARFDNFVVKKAA
jgi:TIR domain